MFDQNRRTYASYLWMDGMRGVGPACANERIEHYQNSPIVHRSGTWPLHVQPQKMHATRDAHRCLWQLSTHPRAHHIQIDVGWLMRRIAAFCMPRLFFSSSLARHNHRDIHLIVSRYLLFSCDTNRFHVSVAAHIAVSPQFFYLSFGAHFFVQFNLRATFGRSQLFVI